MTYGHIVKHGKRYTLYITSDIEGRDTVKRIDGLTRIEARNVANVHGAKPWNF